MAAWLYRRRNRVSPSRPPPDFDLDGGASRGLITQQEHTRPGWAWWRKISQGSQASRQSQSDPGKIDAYQFDYEPLSGWVPSSGSGGSGHGQPGPYDPHRPRRNSDAHLAPRSSMDTFGVRAQASSGALAQNYHSASRNHTPTPAYGSTQNLVYGRATPSPVPGHTPQHSLPQGVSVNHLSSFAYGSPQPPTYGQSIPYTYPYAPQPVPSTSTTSPLSPQCRRIRFNSFGPSFQIFV
ncbi:hypothetical protein B0J17DRAFT_136826 [Rhizoctonia solani]|nr:hypothetical protein B0J17DRAFT_136826 [Rhizoctonia solani]